MYILDNIEVQMNPCLDTKENIVNAPNPYSYY